VKTALKGEYSYFEFGLYTDMMSKFWQKNMRLRTGAAETMTAFKRLKPEEKFNKVLQLLKRGTFT